jgi:glutaminyl-peptide cyclotransferase
MHAEERKPRTLRDAGCGTRSVAGDWWLRTAEVMEVRNRRGRRPLRKAAATQALVALVCMLVFAVGCKSENGGKGQPPFMSAVAGDGAAVVEQAKAPAPETTDGFDGHRAYELVQKQVSFGPRPAGSPELARLQEYMIGELKSYGCAVETDEFSADTPAGRLPMKNILVKVAGEQPGIILLGTHYDTKKLPDFVGADDGGSSTAVMMEVARLLCGQKQPGKYAVWIAFFDAEEAVNREWKDPDNTYGSRQMAAKFAADGEIGKIKAFILVDLVGGRNILFKKETNSTKWLKDQVWKTAQDLGYGNNFVNSDFEVSDDHLSFLKRNVPSVDIVDLTNSAEYWHTPQDAMDKISARSLAVTGHVVMESVKVLQTK